MLNVLKIQHVDTVQRLVVVVVMRTDAVGQRRHGAQQGHCTRVDHDGSTFCKLNPFVGLWRGIADGGMDYDGSLLFGRNNVGRFWVRR